jgi:hypothetical protein
MARIRVAFRLSAVMMAFAALSAPAPAQPQPPSPEKPGPGAGSSPGSQAPQAGSSTFMARLCNHTSPTLYAALVIKRGGDWVVKGWWNVAGGQCVNAERSAYGWVYAYAETNQRTWPNQDNRSANVLDICVAYPGPFERINNTAGYTCDVRLLKKFWGAQVQTGDTFTFDFRAP